MEEKGNATYYSCAPDMNGNVAILLLFLALPFHFFVGKILAFNLRFENPRHIILFCLSASDSLQVTVTAFTIMVSKFGDLEAGTQSCTNLRYAVVFNGALTLIVSSLTLVALSIERYIACFHSYRIHELLTNKRIIPTLVAFWICGVIGGGLACIPNSPRSQQSIVMDSAYFRLIFAFVTISVSIVLTVVQLLLFCLSRKKLNRIQPSSSSSNQVEIENMRKRQIKVAIVASMVVLSYLVCMAPGTSLIIIDLKSKVSIQSFWKHKFTIALAMANTLLNPFIYGFGMLDTREAIVKEVKKIKNYLLIKLRLKDELET